MEEVQRMVRAMGVLADALTHPEDLPQSLARIAELSNVLLRSRQTALLLRDEERQEFIVRTCVGIESAGVRSGHPLVVPDRIRRILWRVRRLHQIGRVEAGIEGLGFPLLVVPLRIKGERVGLLVTAQPQRNGGPAVADGYDEIRRHLFALIASFASLIIENAKIYDYLRQQFAQRSIELSEAARRDAVSTDETQQIMISSVKNPNKVVRLLAVSFYKELARAGFGPDHVTTAAAELLDCIARGETPR